MSNDVTSNSGDDRIGVAARRQVERQARAVSNLVEQLDDSLVPIVYRVHAMTGKVVTTGSEHSAATHSHAGYFGNSCPRCQYRLPRFGPTAAVGDIRQLVLVIDGILVMLIQTGTSDVADQSLISQTSEFSDRFHVGADGGVTQAIAPACSMRVLTTSCLAMRSSRRPHGDNPYKSRPYTDKPHSKLNHHKNGTMMTDTDTDTDTDTNTDMIPATMQASVLIEAGKLEVQQRQVPSCAPDEVLVKVAAVGVCGSDVHYYREGRIGGFVVESPMILGHELSGRIVDTGSAVDAARIGVRVAVEPQRPCGRCAQCRAGRYNLCPFMEFYATPPIDGAFCEYVIIQNDFAHALPDEISDESAALMEPLSVGIAAVRKAKIIPGSRVLITGAGPVGIIAAQTARAFGASGIIVSDLVPERRERALTYGATCVIDPVTDNPADLSLGVDAFIDASGSATAVDSGIRAVGSAGVAVLVGLGNPTMPLPVSHIQDLEISVTGIFRYTDTWPTAIHLVASGQVELDSLVTGKFDLEHVKEALESDQDPEKLKSIVYPSPAN